MEPDLIGNKHGTIVILWYPYGDWFQGPPRILKSVMFKSLIENGVVFAYNLCTSYHIL